MAKRTIVIPKWLRIILPSTLVIVWVTLAAIGGPYFGKISQVASNDQATFLPESAESTKVNEQIGNFQSSNTIPAVIVYSGEDQPLTSDQVSAIATATGSLTSIEGVSGDISPPIVSEDRRAAFVVIATETGVEYKDFLRQIRKKLTSQNVNGLEYKITGPVGFLGDLSNAFSGIDGLLLIVALTVVFIILLVVYRSPLLPFLVLLNAIAALAVAILIVWHLANIGVLQINGQVQGILFILVIGAATDYSLLFVSRYREELMRYRTTSRAILATIKGSFEPILAAGGTVVVGLLCLLLSDLSSNKALGPVGSIGIILAVVSALTFLPALLSVFGRAVFWPRIPHYEKQLKPASISRNHGLWQQVGNFISRKPRAIWVTCSILLLICTFGILGLKADGVAQSDIVIGKSDARDGQAVLNKYFPGGSGTPAQIIVKEDKLGEVAEVLDTYDEVSTVQVAAVGTPANQLPIGKSAADSPNLFPNASPKVVDGNVLVYATLKDSSESLAAQNAIGELRERLSKVDATALVGGISATQLDTNIAADHDRRVVIPVVLVVITIILMVLLRSVIGPLLLLLTTVLSFAATIGIGSLVFNNLFQFPGADPSVILYGFVFLVALGIDYNIFLMTRVREESLKLGTKAGIVHGLIVTGGVITSAGVVLAATFAALGVIPILFLVQLAFIVAVGVLIDTTIVRSLLVPALAYDFDRRIWWPAKRPSN